MKKKFLVWPILLCLLVFAVANRNSLINKTDEKIYDVFYLFNHYWESSDTSEISSKVIELQVSPLLTDSSTIENFWEQIDRIQPALVVVFPSDSLQTGIIALPDSTSFPMILPENWRSSIPNQSSYVWGNPFLPTDSDAIFRRVEMTDPQQVPYYFTLIADNLHIQPISVPQLLIPAFYPQTSIQTIHVHHPSEIAHYGFGLTDRTLLVYFGSSNPFVARDGQTFSMGQLHWLLTQTLQKKAYVQSAGWQIVWGILLMGIIGLILWSSLNRYSFFSFSPWLFRFSFLYIVGCYGLFTAFHYLWPITSFYLAILSFLTVYYNILIKNRHQEERRIFHYLERNLAPTFRSKIPVCARRFNHISHEATILYGQIAPSSALEPDAFFDNDVLSSIQAHLENIVLSHQGTLIRWDGQTFSAAFGLPFPFKHHRERAAEAALHIRNTFHRENWHQSVAIYLHTDTSQLQFARSVNNPQFLLLQPQAATLRKALRFNSYYRSPITANGACIAGLASRFVTRPLQSEPQLIHEIMTTQLHATQRKMLSAYEEAWLAFQQKDYAQAATAFLSIYSEYHDLTSLIFALRCDQWLTRSAQK